MNRPKLRLFAQPAQPQQQQEREEPTTVSVPFGTFAEVIMEAMHNNSTWVNDFTNDTVQIDKDLYEVVLAYQQLQKKRAA